MDNHSAIPLICPLKNLSQSNSNFGDISNTFYNALWFYNNPKLSYGKLSIWLISLWVFLKKKKKKHKKPWWPCQLFSERFSFELNKILWNKNHSLCSIFCSNNYVACHVKHSVWNKIFLLFCTQATSKDDELIYLACST